MSEKIIYEPKMLIPVDGNRAYTLGHKTDWDDDIHYRLTRFLDPTKFEDTFDEITLPYSMAGQTRYLYVNENDRKETGRAKKATIFIEFDDTDGLTITINVDGSRQTAVCTYVQTRQSGMAAEDSNLYRDMIDIFTLEDLRNGKHFDLTVSKVVPSDGDVEIFGQELTVYGDRKEEEEFYDNTDSPSGANTFVVEADASPEVDAYA